MQHSLEKYLEDIQDALAAIESYIAGKTLLEYQQSRQFRAAVEREFITVGEVMSHMIHRFPESKQRIDHARRIANFRHFLVHEYHSVSEEVVWANATKSAPILKQQVETWLAELDALQP